MVRQKGRVRRGVFPWVSWALRTERPTVGDVRLWRIACHNIAGSAGLQTAASI
jgi:hypothetical protein